MNILFMLKSDCGNLAMTNLYTEFRRRGITPDICAFRFEANDIWCFEDTRIMRLEDVNIHDYDVLLTARNIFDYPIPVEEILDYRGLIVSDNTTLYEGDDVYGDVVFVSGRNNYDTSLRSGVKLPTVAGGCLKAFGQERKTRSNKIVWIESGHFPYGKTGREQEAELIGGMCRSLPQYKIVIKPRYLPMDCMDAKHSNGDHLYGYLTDIVCDVDNLVLLDRHYALADVLEDARTVIHTYSSAFQEAVLLGKGIINIGDIDSEETIDLRKNRFGKIKAYIDKAGQTCNRREVFSRLPDGIYCTNEYRRYILGSVLEPAKSAADDICLMYERWKEHQMLPECFFEKLTGEEFVKKDDALVRRRRIKGAANHMIAQFEYYLDEYVLFRELKSRLYENNWRETLKADIDQLICQHFDQLNRNVFNQAYLMSWAYENKTFDPLAGWKNLLCRESFFYYSGKYWESRGAFANARHCFEQYLKLEKGRVYPRTAADKREYVTDAVCSLKRLLV